MWCHSMGMICHHSWMHSVSKVLCKYCISTLFIASRLWSGPRQRWATLAEAPSTWPPPILQWKTHAILLFPMEVRRPTTWRLTQKWSAKDGSLHLSSPRQRPSTCRLSQVRRNIITEDWACKNTYILYCLLLRWFWWRLFISTSNLWTGWRFPLLRSPVYTAHSKQQGGGPLHL